MKQKSRKHYEARARIAKALAHPTRLVLLEALRKGELCVCDLTDLAGVDQSTISRHLGVLKEAGLVTARKEGLLSYYRVTCTCLDGFFKCMEIVVKENLKAQQAWAR